MINDSVHPSERLSSPPRLSLWWEEYSLQHLIAEKRAHINRVQEAADTLPDERDDLHKLLDYQRKRGFAHIEKLHGVVIWINWPMFYAALTAAGAVIWLWWALRSV